jgi:hypothetical protein
MDPSGNGLILKPCAWSVAVILSWTFVACFTRIGDRLNSYFLAVTLMICTLFVSSGGWAGAPGAVLRAKNSAPATSREEANKDLAVILIIVLPLLAPCNQRS